MKLTADMLTVAGFTAIQLGKEQMLELTQTNGSKQFYVGISGGGWRALSGDMGTFRTLSNTSLLSKVTMFSSVSGGSWFLSKLSFDKHFAEKVLKNDVPITEVVSEWFEKNYFPQMQRVDQPDSDDGGIKSSLAEILSQVAGPIKQILKQSFGTSILAADRYDLSWQAMVEQAVLGKQIANKTLATAELTPATRTKFGKQCTLSFNWNQLPQWDDDTRQWFLKKRNVQTGSEYVQYPVYTSAQYELSEDGNSKVEIRAQGKPIAEVLSVCSQNNVRENDRVYNSLVQGLIDPALSRFVTDMTQLAKAILDVFAAMCFFTILMSGIRTDDNANTFVFVLCFCSILAMWYCGQLQLSDNWIQNVMITVMTAIVCCLTTIYALDQNVNTAAAVLGTGCVAGPIAALLTGVVGVLFSVWENREDKDKMQSLKHITILATICVVVNFIIVYDRLFSFSGLRAGILPIIWLHALIFLTGFVILCVLIFGFKPCTRKILAMIHVVVSAIIFYDRVISSIPLPTYVTIFLWLHALGSLTGFVILCVVIYGSKACARKISFGDDQSIVELGDIICVIIYSPSIVLPVCVIIGVAIYISQDCIKEDQDLRSFALMLKVIIFANAISNLDDHGDFSYRYMKGVVIAFYAIGFLVYICMSQNTAYEVAKNGQMSTLTPVFWLFFLWFEFDKLMPSYPGIVVMILIFANMTKNISFDRHIFSSMTKNIRFDRLNALIKIVIIVSHVGVLITAVWSWVLPPVASELHRECDAYKFDFEGLTIGQVAAASSAAAGGGAVRVWVESALEFARMKLNQAMGGLQCRISSTLISQVFKQKRVQDESLSLVGCNETEPSRITAERWSRWLRDMAVKMKLTPSTRASRMSNMAIDAVGSDNML